MSSATVIAISEKLNAALAKPEPTPPAPTLEPGIYDDISMLDYLKLPYMSASRLETLRRSPLQYLHGLTAEPTMSPALERGTALHMAVLEPEEFKKHYAIIGKCVGTKKNSERCEYNGSVIRGGVSWCKTHAPNVEDDDVEILTEADFKAVLGMRDRIAGHARANSLFQGKGAFELTVIWDDEETGIRCKIRPDRIIRRAGMLVDIKTTRDAAPWAFPRQAESLGYWRKLALYRRGLLAHEWPYQVAAVLAIEPTDPYDLLPYMPDESDIDSADREVTSLLRVLRYCQETNAWPGYGDEFAILNRPAWAKEN